MESLGRIAESKKLKGAQKNGWLTPMGRSTGWDVFSVVLEDGPIRMHFHSLYGLGQNVTMNGCTPFGTSSRIEVGQSDH